MPDLSYPFTIIVLLLGAPLLGFSWLLFSGRGGERHTGLIAVTTTAIGLLLSLVTAVWGGEHFISLHWVSAGRFDLDLAFRLDNLTGIMLPLVHFIALLVQCYSIAYMKGDHAFHRYFAFLQLFLFSMLGIVLAGNLVVMYIFWELVGLSSYLLIGFWYLKPRTVWAAQKAFILNRIGDAAFLCGILLLIYHTGTTSFEALPAAVGEIPQGKLTLIGLLLFGGCIGKSAQFPLSGWLPDAMEGPTPVSALIHAATMVAAGIFLLARIGFLVTPLAGNVIVWVGLITMVDGAVRACREWDIKRLLAFSTQSQLGLMVFAAGIGAWQLALFHLVTHAFFKAGLFLSAGSVIHAMTPHITGGGTTDPQDMRTMGGLRTVIPITFLCYALCAAALSGVPFFSGFLSKDAVFVHAFEWAGDPRHGSFSGLAHLAVAGAMASAALTAYYMARQVWLIFGGQPRYGNKVHPHEAPQIMWVPMAVLATLSLFFFFSINPFDGSGGWLLTRLEYSGEAHSLLAPVLSVLATGGGVLAAWGRIRKDGFLEADSTVGRFLPWLALRDYSEKGHATVFFLPAFQLAGQMLKWVEAKLVDGMVHVTGCLTVVIAHLTGRADRFAVDGMVRLTAGTARFAGHLVRSLQNGRIQSYFLVTFAGLIALLIWLMIGA